MTQKYLLLKWKDGVQVVSALEPESKGLLRYYTISRVEEFGRIGIDSKDDYPGLIIIDRKPRELEEIVFTGDFKAKQYTLNPAGEYHEAGRIDHKFEFTEAENGLDDLLGRLIKVLKKENKEAETIRGLDGDKKRAELEGIRKAMKLRALKKEGDVLGFIEMLLTQITWDQSR